MSHPCTLFLRVFVLQPRLAVLLSILQASNDMSRRSMWQQQGRIALARALAAALTQCLGCLAHLVFCARMSTVKMVHVIHEAVASCTQDFNSPFCIHCCARSCTHAYESLVFFCISILLALSLVTCLTAVAASPLYNARGVQRAAGCWRSLQVCSGCWRASVP